jgi:hypothetical protein
LVAAEGRAVFSVAFLIDDWLESAFIRVHQQFDFLCDPP